MFVGVSYLVFWIAYRPTVSGFRDGCFVLGGSLLMTAPWWGTVVARHGINTYLAASGAQPLFPTRPLYALTHSTILFAPTTLPTLLLNPWHLGLLLGAAFLLLQRQYVLPIWLFVVDWIFLHSRFAWMLAAVIFAAAARLSLVALADVDVTDFTLKRRQIVVIVVALVLGSHALLGAVGYASSSPISTTGPFGDREGTLPSFLDDADMAAFQWTRTHTAPAATFLIVGSTAEWFPQQTDRTIILGIWGTEWVEGNEFERQFELFRDLSYCSNAACITDLRQRLNHHPDYLYVPKGQYSTIYDNRRTQPSSMRQSLVKSDHYHIVYENEGVIIANVT